MMTRVWIKGGREGGREGGGRGGERGRVFGNGNV